VIGLVALTCGAAGLSLATSGSLTTDNDPVATAALRQAVEGALNAPNFAMAVLQTVTTTDPILSSRASTTTDSQYIVYQRPNRCLVEVKDASDAGGMDTIIMGRVEYVKPADSSTWARSPVLQEAASAVPELTASGRATQYLKFLLQTTTVQMSTNGFSVDIEPDAVIDNHESNAKKWAASAAVVVRGGVVTQEDVTITGSDHVMGKTLTYTEHDEVTYSAFGTSPPVTAPPASDVSG
jgi:hypothetical protein